MDPARPSFLFVQQREKLHDYLRKLTEAKLTKQTQMNYLKAVKRLVALAFPHMINSNVLSCNCVMVVRVNPGCYCDSSLVYTCTCVIHVQIFNNPGIMCIDRFLHYHTVNTDMSTNDATLHTNCKNYIEFLSSVQQSCRKLVGQEIVRKR